MQAISINNTLLSSERIIIMIVLAELLLMQLSGVGFAALHGNPFYNIGADPLYLFLYFFNIPQTIIQHLWLGRMLDFTVIVLLITILLKPNHRLPAVFCLMLLIIYYCTLTGYLGHRNFQSGFCWVLLPFIFRKPANRMYAFDFVRYILLFFYASAALLKLFNQSVFSFTHFSDCLLNQFTSYFLENNLSFRTSLNLFLIGHKKVSFALFILSFLTELTPMLGFFTRRFDRWIGILLIVFHLFNWLIMDIAPWGQMAFIALLLTDRRHLER